MSRAVDKDGLVREFFRITRLPHDPFTKEFLNRCQSYTVKVHGKFYKYYQSGSGPTVLLVHGVHSNLGSMTAIAESLLAQNYQVVLFNAPAHGEALGTTTDPIEAGEVICGISARFTELYAIIGHSLGGLWALSAWHSGARAKALVSISAPANTRFLVDKFAELADYDDGQVQELTGQLESHFGREVWAGLSPSEVVKTIDVPGLIIHGASDDYVPPSHAKEIHSNWRRSTMELVQGAGHFDIAELPNVQEIIAAYLQKVE